MESIENEDRKRFLLEVGNMDEQSFRIKIIAIQVPRQVNECNICADCCTSHLRRIYCFIVCKQCVYVTLSALSSVPVFLLYTVMNPPFQPNSWHFSESSA